MKMTQLIINDDVATVILDRSDKMNAFNNAFIEELIATFSALQNNQSIRAVIIRAQGKHFCAGADLAWMQAMKNYSYEENLADAKRLALLFETIYKLNKPTISLVQGAAFGGGAGLVCCTDIVLAEANTRFCFSEAKLGIAAATISPYVIQKIGTNKAKRFFMTAEVLNSQMALETGLIDEICEDMDLHAHQFIDQIRNNGPKAVAESKLLAQSFFDLDSDTINRTAELIATLRTSDEGQEGLVAFLEKRQPKWIQT